ncbi:phage/plasmid replication protein [Salinisphaera sp. SPP-AMP-43]|uniref:phage/plasmid replication domain-containing protein n=1 Tax=Salinisphaera sp. SPP-AMP-43 TaxID=3121288 RepID=UPI003C6E95CE
MSWSVDWLSVSQDHQAGCSVLGADFVIHTDPESGQVTREHIVGYQHQGSHDSSLRIRSDGYRVEISGNPSRYNRPDNVFGFKTVNECMALYNELLRDLGLPEFTKGHGLDRAKSGTVKVVDGARFSRVDLAWNYEAGSSANVAHALRGLSASSRRGSAFLVGKDGMVYSGAKDYVRVKYYDKAKEMQSHSRKACAKDETRRTVQAWAESVGLLRFEVELGRKYLLEHQMNGWIMWDDERAQAIAAGYDKVRDMTFATTDYQHIADDLENRFEFKPGRALKAQHAALAWLAGEDLRQSMSKSAFYRVTADLRLVGVDVRAPCNVAALPVRVRVVDLSAAQVPSWYERPSRPSLRLVA